jgi:hypothetical protein
MLDVTKLTPGPWHIVDYAGFLAVQDKPDYGKEYDLLDYGDEE